MPLLGHAFTGMATALIVAPHSSHNHAKSLSAASAPFLTTSLVILSYLPDIVSQCCLFFDWYDGRKLGHSLLFALLISPAAGFILNHQTSFTKKQCFLLAFATILLHDLLDILQSTDRQPLWPFDSSLVGNGITIIPHDPTKEALLFGLIYCLVLAWYLYRRRGKKLGHNNDQIPAFQQKWSERILIGSIILIALTTYHLRIQRVRLFHQAVPFLHQQRYSELLNMLDKVDKWPRIAKPGRIDYFRGVAYWKQHRIKIAEKYLLQSYARDHNFFWCVADLALIYASSDQPQLQRASLAAPYIHQLQTQFSRHRDYSNYMKKINKHLATSH